MQRTRDEVYYLTFYTCTILQHEYFLLRSVWRAGQSGCNVIFNNCATHVKFTFQLLLYLKIFDWHSDMKTTGMLSIVFIKLSPTLKIR